MPTSIKKAYIRIGRYLRKCRVEILKRERRVVITIFPEIAGTTVRVRGELPLSELHALLDSKGIREIELRPGDSVLVTRYGLRRRRKDLVKLFPEDIKGNIVELLIRVRGGSSFSLIMIEKDAIKLERFLKGC